MPTITEVEKLASGSKVDLIVAAGETLQKQKIAVRLPFDAELGIV
jgi:transketolase